MNPVTRPRWGGLALGVPTVAPWVWLTGPSARLLVIEAVARDIRRARRAGPGGRRIHRVDPQAVRSAAENRCKRSYPAGQVALAPLSGARLAQSMGRAPEDLALKAVTHRDPYFLDFRLRFG
jgi:hypothetical protein